MSIVIEDIINRIYEICVRNGVDFLNTEDDVNTSVFNNIKSDLQNEFEIELSDDWFCKNIITDRERLYEIIIDAVRSKNRRDTMVEDLKEIKRINMYYDTDRETWIKEIDRFLEEKKRLDNDDEEDDIDY